MIVLRRLLTLCNERTSARGFTIDDIAKLPKLRDRQVKRNSIIIALNRFIKLGIAFSPGASSKNKKLYRIKNSQWAVAYIEGDKDKPWLSLTPTLGDDTFTDFDEHRDHFDIQLPKDSFDVLQRLGSEKNNQFTFKCREYTISVNGKSLSGQVFVRPYWRTRIKRDFGEDFFNYLQDLDSRGARRGDFCLPIDVKGQRFTIGGRPTQFSSSHYPAQLDIRASKGDDHIRDGLLALTNQADFNTRILDFQDAVLEALEKQGASQTKMAETLEKLVKLLTPNGEPEYKNNDGKDEDGVMYG